MKYDKESLLKDDIQYVWHPDTQMKDYETESPIIVEKAKGIWVYDIDGNKYIDAVSSWWVNTLGHSNERLNKVLYEQAQTIEHILFAGFTHPWAIELAKKLVEMTAPELTKVFYSDNGSTAVEVALKMAYQYWYQTGKPEKKKFVALKNSYHGDTLGAVSVGGIELYKKIFAPMVFDIIQVENPYCYRCPKGLNPKTCQTDCIKYVEQVFEEHHKEIAAVVIEPIVQGAVGMVIYPPAYIKHLRALCDRYNILLIHDEVAVGFGRTGKMFAYEHSHTVPDILCLAKGITAGYLPLAVTMATDKIFNAFYDDYEKIKAFYHGHSYTANPLAVRVAVENLKILEEENIIKTIQAKSEYLKQKIQKLNELEHVGDVRHIGMIVGIELVKDKKTKLSYEFKERIGHKIHKEALKLGAILRPTGNVIYFMPPYIISESEIDLLVDITYSAIKKVTEN